MLQRTGELRVSLSIGQWLKGARVSLHCLFGGRLVCSTQDHAYLGQLVASMAGAVLVMESLASWSQTTCLSHPCAGKITSIPEGGSFLSCFGASYPRSSLIDFIHSTFRERPEVCSAS